MATKKKTDPSPTKGGGGKKVSKAGKALAAGTKVRSTRKGRKGAEGKALTKGAQGEVLTFREGRGVQRRGVKKGAGLKATGLLRGEPWIGTIRPEGFALKEQERDVSPGESKLRNAFARRVSEWGMGVAESAPEEVLADALARMNARGSILHVMDAIPSDEEKSEAALLRERAIQRALAVREELAREAGGMKSTAEVAERLGVKRQSVDRYRRDGKLLSLETPQGHVFPACQIGPDGVVRGLDEVLSEMKGLSFWEALSGLLTPTPTLGGKSVLEALKAARSEERQKIREVAHEYAAE